MGLFRLFPSARGVRQGCPLSSYLYVIVTNVLSHMLNQSALEAKFGYHPKCKEVQLTHLNFADDILVFTDGTGDSLAGVLEVRNQFAETYGLHINTSKPFIIAAGKNSQHLNQVAALKGLMVDTLPIRYLGIPLTSRCGAKQIMNP